MKYKYKEISLLCDLQIGNTPDRKEKKYWGKGYSWVSISDLKEKYICKTKEQITKTAILEKNCKVVKKGTLLMSFKLSIGKLAFTSCDLYTNEAIVAFNIKNEKLLDKEYLYYALKFIPLLKDAKSAAKGKTLNLDSLRKIKIPLPNTIYEQKCIVILLSKIDTLIKKRKESIDLLEKLIENIFLNMFGDPIINSKNHNKVKLKDFGEIITGNTPKRLQRQYYNDNYIEWIKTDNLLNDTVYASKAKEYLSLEGLSVGRSVKEGSVLVNCIAGSLKSIGNVALVNRRVAFNQQINAIQPHYDISSYFLYQMIKISKNYIQDKATKGMKNIITKSTFENILFPKPDYNLQKEFNKYFKKKETIKKDYLNSLEHLNNLYDNFSQKIFDGEISLNNLKIKDVDIDVFMRQDNTNELNKLVKDETPSNENIKNITNVSDIANLIKEEFKDNHFNIEMLIKLLKEKKFDVKYFTSKELKENKKIDLFQDIKNIVFQFIDKNNDFLNLEQLFYNEKEKNFKLKLRTKDKNYIKGKTPEEISGIYLKVVK